jgi:hypothetical protein
VKRLTVVVSMAVAAVMLFAVGAAQAAPAGEKATGSILMGTGAQNSEKQAIDFAVFENPMKGNITYTNFEYADPGSGVWVAGDAGDSASPWTPGAPFDVSFEYQGQCQGACVHTLQLTEFKSLSPDSVSFKGTGFYAPNQTWTETFTGKIVGSTIKLTLDADDDGALYGWNLTKLDGTIAPNGSISGSWIDDMVVPREGLFEIAAGAVSEVFSFTTTPTCVDVTPGIHVAKFGYTIPAGAPAELAGQPVAVNVTDGGSSGALNDTYKHNFAAAANSCLPRDGAYSTYPITAGNLTVHG